MKTKVCPCCDQPISGIYCKGCRKIVLHPVEQDVQYYLNTRHPEFSHDCTFHEEVPKVHTASGQVRNSAHTMTAWETEAKKAEIKERMQQRKRERQSGVDTVAQTLKKAAQSSNRQRSASSQTVLNGDMQAKRTRSALITAITMVIVIFTIAFTFVMIQVINTMNNATRFGWVEAVPEPLATVPAVETPVADAPWPDMDYSGELLVPAETDPATMEVWELTDEEVRSAGVACNGFGHFPMMFDDVVEVLYDGIRDAGYGWTMHVYSYNQFIEEYTWYETVYEFTIHNKEEYAGYLNITVDTATREIHGMELYTKYEKGFFEVADIAVKFLDKIGAAEIPVDGTEFFETAYKAQEDDWVTIQNGLEVICEIPDGESEFYRMEIYAPGYYTIAE